MAAGNDKDMPEQLAAIRAEIASLTKTVSQLESHTAEIHAGLKQRFGKAAKSAVNEAEKLGDDAIHLAAHGATAAVTDVEASIVRNPLAAVLIALGLGLAIGMHGRK